ncbi:MAG: class I SAM-dependent methyltransferase, partial [Gammaproteobacteria bacterium]|nr:class I SAM-dependent methyltransferase [Gammaproteobacteria bacterium]
MTESKNKTIKENVNRFDDDVRKTGSYAYTAEKLSSKYANARISKAINDIYQFSGKRVLDLGCGDGAYTLEFKSFGVKEILGVDPAAVAVAAANNKAEAAGISEIVKFKVGNIYNLNEVLGDEHFDCIVLRGVLHHLPDPEKAIQCISSLSDTVVILEPNGYNPVLKVLERVSRYHIEHEERSFFSTQLRSWCNNSGLEVEKTQMINLVPMFCPDWMAKLCKGVEPLVEKIPVLRQISCGQCLIVAHG